MVDGKVEEKVPDVIVFGNLARKLSIMSMNKFQEQYMVYSTFPFPASGYATPPMEHWSKTILLAVSVPVLSLKMYET